MLIPETAAHLQSLSLRRDLTPFLKWPGGKRWASSYIASLVACHLGEKGRYVEPFLGSGAVFFKLGPRHAVLGDINRELIEVYRAVKTDPLVLERALARLPVTSSFYDHMRNYSPTCRLKVAERFLYLNRTCFGGMYRVNRSGEFNVPYGGGERNPQALCDSGILASASKALSRARILHADFGKVIRMAKTHDVVYCDPTYTVAHNNNAFVRYNERNFSWEDQKRLARECRDAAARGATVIVSNACHPSILALYRDWKRVVLKRFSCLTPVVSKRRETREYVFLSCSLVDCNCNEWR